MNKEGEKVAEMDVPVDRYIYFATEDAGIDVPIINKHKMCRNGCCTTCAAKVVEGKVRYRGHTPTIQRSDCRSRKLTEMIGLLRRVFFFFLVGRRL